MINPKCEDCGGKEFTIYNYGLVACVECGQMKDMKKPNTVKPLPYLRHQLPHTINHKEG